MRPLHSLPLGFFDRILPRFSSSEADGVAVLNTGMPVSIDVSLQFNNVTHVLIYAAAPNKSLRGCI